MSLGFKQNYLNVQIVARKMMMEVAPDLEEHEFYDDIIHEMVESILTSLYESYSEREISNGLILLLAAIEVDLKLT